ncbi:hypothetical protein IM538_13100 [Cytobacillus suaedae]|nr:hypothetical protein IM538_13100 [Cytobacillus suaedae]
MKRFINLSVIVLMLFVITACSDDEYDKEYLILKYQTQIDEKNIEITNLEEELRLINDELAQERKNQEKLQIFDHKARNIMKHIANNEFGKLRSEFDVDFEVIDGKVNFGELSDYYFPIEIAGLPMYFKYYNPQSDSTEVGYFLYGYDQNGSERKYDIHFRFGKNNEFLYVGSE